MWEALFVPNAQDYAERTDGPAERTAWLVCGANFALADAPTKN